MEFEETILPSFLLSSDIVCEEAPKFGNRRCVLRGLGGGDGGGILGASQGSSHCGRMENRCVVLFGGRMSETAQRGGVCGGCGGALRDVDGADSTAKCDGDAPTMGRTRLRASR